MGVGQGGGEAKGFYAAEHVLYAVPAVTRSASPKIHHDFKPLKGLKKLKNYILIQYKMCSQGAKKKAQKELAIL